MTVDESTMAAVAPFNTLRAIHACNPRNASEGRGCRSTSTVPSVQAPISTAYQNVDSLTVPVAAATAPSPAPATAAPTDHPSVLPPRRPAACIVTRVVVGSRPVRVEPAPQG